MALPLAAAWPLTQASTAPSADGAKKVLRVSFSSAETSFDPASINDIYSSTVAAHIFEGLFGYDHLARPVKIKPLLAAAMPEVSADFRVWTIRVRPGVYFQDDPAFKGQRRELVAEDFAYALRRIVDPVNKSPVATTFVAAAIVGLGELRKAAQQTRQPFDYNTPIEGLTALDRHTLRITLAEPRPRLIEILAQGSKIGAQAREVVEFYGAKIGEHPVGTGPFRLKKWVRSSKIVLERNVAYRERYFEGEPAADDAEGQAILARMKGKRLPLVDEVEVSIIEESQPRWLSFLNGQIDGLLATAGPMPPEFAPLAVPNGKLAPHLAKRGVQLFRVPRSDSSYQYFNMNDPVVGGMTPDKVALRRAISLAYDVGREIRLARGGQAIPAQGPTVPFTTGYDPAFKSSMSEYSPAKARALLDMHGYIDRDGDGWRELPDGKPLKLVFSTEPEQVYRTFNDIVRRCMTAVGLRVEFETQKWPAHYKQAQAGTLQIWQLG